jgi:hypothetical protein
MKLTSKHTCKCGFQTPFQFQKPWILSPTFGSVTCQGCESKFLIKLWKPSPNDKIEKGAYRSQVKVIFQSVVLGMLLKEERGEYETVEPRTET